MCTRRTEEEDELEDAAAKKEEKPVFHYPSHVHHGSLSTVQQIELWPTITIPPFITKTPHCQLVSPTKVSPVWAWWLSVGPRSLEDWGWQRDPLSFDGWGDSRVGVWGCVYVCVCVLQAITSSILSSIIHVRRIIALGRSPLASSDITVNPLKHTNTERHTHTHDAKQAIVCLFRDFRETHRHCTCKQTHTHAIPKAEKYTNASYTHTNRTFL